MAVGKIKQIAGVCAVAVFLVGGCRARRAGDGNQLVRGLEPVEQLVEERLREERAAKSGQERWESQKTNEYQSLEDIVRDRHLLSEERLREKEARRLMAAGPLRLVDCVVFALEYNDAVKVKRAAIDAVGGDELVVRSRFLPHLFFNLEKEIKDIETDEERSERTDSLFRVSQTLLEFGKDNPQDVFLREWQQAALFGYEDAVREVLSEVRLKFFTILLREQQLAERVELLEEFRDRYEEISKRFEKKTVEEMDVLTARLNMLNEEARINSLKKEVLRQKIDLSHLMGAPVGMTDFQLEGKLTGFEMDLSQIVDFALKRSTDIAQGRWQVAEQRRRVREFVWEYAPELRLQGAWKDGKNAAGMELSSEDGTYDLSPFAERHVGSMDDGFSVGGNALVGETDLSEEEEGWYLGLALELPIYEGGKRKGEYAKEIALLDEARHSLGDTIDRVEVEVRKVYQTMLEREVELTILAETVEISKKRLKVKDRLNVLDRITDNELETFRDRFFADQDVYFRQQIAYIAAQEELRSLMGHFEPLPVKEDKKDESSP